jgi:SAM-dependent methyltransferase
MAFAEQELKRAGGGRLLDIGCGAGRNALPLVRLGWHVVGIDLSWPMLVAAANRAREHRLGDRIHVVLAPMERIPARDRCFDVVIAHGIWNLARSAAQFRRALGEAARVAKPGAGLFVFTFSRNTLPAQTAPVAGEPQCFLTEARLDSELGRAGFLRDPFRIGCSIPCACGSSVCRRFGALLGAPPLITPRTWESNDGDTIPD